MPKTKPPKGPVHQSLAQLGELVSKRKTTRRVISKGDPLFQACQLIGQEMGMTFRPAHCAPYGVEEICKASGIRCRSVRLEGTWWKEGQDHLLAFDETTHRPIALIHCGEGNYERVDPATGERKGVQSHSGILPTAYMFYDVLSEPLSGRKVAHFIWKGSSNLYIALVLLGAIIPILGFFFPIANQLLFDWVIPSSNETLFIQVLIGLMISALSATVFLFLRSLLLLLLKGRVENRFQALLWHRVLKLPLKFLTTISTGDLIQRTLLIDQLRRTLNDNTLLIVLNGLFSSLYLLVMLYYSPQLAFAGLSLILCATCISLGLYFVRLSYLREALASRATLNTFLTQLITAIGKCRVAAAESRVLAHWAEIFSHNQWLQLRTGRLRAMASTSNAILGTLSPLVLFATLLFMINAHPEEMALSVGSFLAFNAAFSPFSIAFFEMMTTLASFVGLIPFWERLRPLLSEPVETTADRRDPGRLTGKLEVHNVFFRYQPHTDFLFNNLSLHVHPGECIGIVGPSGSGKSTLCRLLLGFEIPEKGTVSYDNQSLSWLDLDQVREQIGVVLQTSSLFSGSLYENITCGRSYSKNELDRAIAQSTLDRDLANLPMGLHTLLLTGGGTLSGGQRQKLLLARALIRQPKLLILDEATSSLDNQTQGEIIRTLESLQITRILIAHRVQAVRNANRIYVLEKGKITAEGSFEQLRKQKGPWHN